MVDIASDTFQTNLGPPILTNPVSGETGANPAAVIVDSSSYVDSLYDVQAPSAQVVVAIEISPGVWRPWHTVIEESVNGLWVPGGVRHQITITNNTGAVSVFILQGQGGYSSDSATKLSQMEITSDGINFVGDVTADGTIS